MTKPSTTNNMNREANEIEAAKKDLKKFSILYDRYYIQVFRFIYGRVESEDDAADLTSSAFLKAMSKLKSYQHKGHPFSSWLYMIARNEVNLFYRSQKTERKYYIETKHLSSIKEEITENKEQCVNQLIASMQELPDDDYDLIQMKYFEKLKYEEIAEITGKDEKNLRVQIHRIKKKLKKLILHKSGSKEVDLLALIASLLIIVNTLF